MVLGVQSSKQLANLRRKVDRHYDKLDERKPDLEKEKNRKLQSMLKQDASHELDKSLLSSRSEYFDQQKRTDSMDFKSSRALARAGRSIFKSPDRMRKPGSVIIDPMSADQKRNGN